MTRAEQIKSMDEKLKALRSANRKQEARLRARKQRLEAAERAKERKLRTRRLILMGSYMEHIANRDQSAKDRLLRGLDGFLSKDRDRELFELPPKEGTDG